MKYNFAEAGERVRKLRKGAKLSQAAFLEKLSERGVDIARNRLSGLENGVQKSFSLEILLAAADIFGCDVGFLLCEYDERTKDVHDIVAFTGLSEKAIDMIRDCNDSFKCTLNSLLESFNFWALIGAIEAYRVTAKDAAPIELWLEKGEYAAMRENSSVKSIEKRDLNLFRIQELVKAVAKEGCE